MAFGQKKYLQVVAQRESKIVSTTLLKQIYILKVLQKDLNSFLVSLTIL